MSRIFLSHHNSNNQEALALKLWLESQGWRDEIFLDLDLEAGIKTGTRWKDALVQAGSRCEAVVCLTSPGWVESAECLAEYRTAENMDKNIFVAQLAELGSADKTQEWQRCRLFGDGPVTEIAMGPQHPPVRFLTDGLARLKHGLLEAGISGVFPKHFHWPPEHEPKREPYRGLKPLEFVDAGVYFGRDAEILHGLAELDRMRLAGNTPLFIILGASGTGKSSFLRAGLLPRLKRDDQHFFPLDIIRPERSPLFGDSGMAQAIAPVNHELKLHPMKARQVEAELKKGPGALSVLLRRIQEAAHTRLVGLAEASVPPTLVLPVDQAEELFNADATEEARTFLNMIGAILRGDPEVAGLQRVTMIVAFTIRSDRYGPLQTATELNGIGRVLFDDLRPMHPAQFKEVIIGPASRARINGLPLEVKPNLVNKLVSDCSTGADTLPLLGLILERLFRKYGSDGELQLNEYLTMGALADVVRTEAESILSNNENMRKEQLAQLRAGFIPFLVTINRDNNQPMRRVARMADLPQDSRPLIQALIERRLLVSDLRNNEQVVEVAHESLLRQWKVLKDWLDVERDDLKEADRLEEDAKLWTANGKLVRSVAFSPDGTKVASTGDEQIVRLWEVQTGHLQKNFLGHESYVESIAYSRDGSKLVSGSLDRTVRLWDVQKGAQIGAPLSGHSGPVGSVSFSPDGTKIVSGSADKTLRLWNALTGQPIGEPLVGHEAAVTSVAFSPDGTMVVSGGRDHMLRLWDIRTKQSIGTPLAGHRAEVTSVAFSPDGRTVASGSDDQTLRLWDVQTRQLIGAEISGHKGGVTSVAFSPDGTNIASASADKMVRLWPARTVWPDLLCTKLAQNMSRKQWREHVSSEIDYIEQCSGLPVPPDELELPSSPASEKRGQ